MQILEYKRVHTSELGEFSSEEFLSGLEAYLKRNKIDKALDLGFNYIKARHYTGVIRYKNFQLEIFPKLLSRIDNVEDEECRVEDYSMDILKNLIYMLSFTRKLDIRTTGVAELSNCANPFLEILIREFVNSLFNSLKRLTPKNYIREEGNLNYFKGKLKLAENIRYNCANEAKFYCEYDEYSENNPLNQLFLFVSTCLYAISRDNKNKKLLKFVINYYSDIDLVYFDKYSVNKIVLSRNQKLFERAFKLAKMFIEHSSVNLLNHRVENITLLWDMNLLFEEFIYEFMKRELGNKIDEIKYQKGKRLLRSKKGTYGNTYADMFIKLKDGRTVILDTKYKLDDGSDSNFNNNDVFQVMTYSQIHSSNEAILLYPVSQGAELAIRDSSLNTDDPEDKKSLRIASIDLRVDLANNTSDLIRRLEDILEPIQV